MEQENGAIYCRLSQDDGSAGESGSIQTQLGRSLPGTFGIIDLHGSVRVKNAGMAAKRGPCPQRDRLQGHAARDAPERAVRQAGNASRP